MASLFGFNPPSHHQGLLDSLDNQVSPRPHVETDFATETANLTRANVLQDGKIALTGIADVNFGDVSALLR
ncbi:hypothetical protein [Thiospirillum jenense]|uniref:Uncharacterized protein n=1 Tax=Thiospirillum jenense TaxID=1653858 RepID=A0A839H9C6_9GAMM|nr:hypothetical protein [Thiospirillum jenense]MBB1125641.1 hypothetical protein [Thiospirillum jenense]